MLLPQEAVTVPLRRQEMLAGNRKPMHRQGRSNPELRPLLLVTDRALRVATESIS